MAEKDIDVLWPQAYAAFERLNKARRARKAACKDPEVSQEEFEAIEAEFFDAATAVAEFRREPGGWKRARERALERDGK